MRIVRLPGIHHDSNIVLVIGTLGCIIIDAGHHGISPYRWRGYRVFWQIMTVKNQQLTGSFSPLGGFHAQVVLISFFRV